VTPTCGLRRVTLNGANLFVPDTSVPLPKISSLHGIGPARNGDLDVPS